jgi:hypothetical protein
MNKLSRAIFWGGVFVTTIALAIGVSLLAVRVRAAVDARRTSAGVQAAVLPASEDLVAPAAQTTDPEGAGELPCVSAEDICDGPWGFEPASSSPPLQTAEPQAAETPRTYRDCCGVLRVISPSGTQTAPQAAVPEAQQNAAPLATPEPTPLYRVNCH